MIPAIHDEGTSHSYHVQYLLSPRAFRHTSNQSESGPLHSRESRRRLSKDAMNEQAESIAFVPDLPDITASSPRAVFDITRLRVAGPGH